MLQTTTIQTDKAERLMKALCNHFARKITAHYEGSLGFIEFGDGKCQLTAAPSHLTLQVEAENAESLARVGRVVVEHLLRFTPDEHFDITWESPAP
jgi:uncharacterized protein